ncbi:Serine/threonine-protein kinase AFC2 [Acorus calamus]|uniref:Serine/threonine-protein kinase AFC2 n=1 Tax=Acorus calamus TaxID=4465 RepID=A0AAV9DQ34_ACOCL|nr:Serine/threonine-protein kinase AFC2 [Acorus calamus]
MAASEVKAVLDFLRKNGLVTAESALRDDVVERGDLCSFLFPDAAAASPRWSPPPPLRLLRSAPDDAGAGTSTSSSDAFLSMTSPSTSELMNPYGFWPAPAEAAEDSSSDMEFGTAREYNNDSDIFSNVFWYDEPLLGSTGSPLGIPGEDPFFMTIEAEESFGRPDAPLCDCCAGSGKDHIEEPEKELQVLSSSELVTDLFENCDSGSDTRSNTNGCTDNGFASNFDEGKSRKESELLSLQPEINHDRTGDAYDEEFEVFDLRIIHRKNRTGFEENKDLPIVLNSVLAGRYYITEYLGSAAFSKVIQAHDLLTGIDVCLKIIKNDKDFFDQSLDEIKLLKFVNKHDPADERHILRLYDYFYHQEHLFIVCELLRANLYEFQKYNQDFGREQYFNLPRLQAITRQCLEALEYLHHLGVIHCDLKPENILIKSYSRCEIKIIDLGSSCFQTDNLCLYVQSRSYRAPEVILGLPYDEKIDIWSIGCIVAELYSGEVLFPNDTLVMSLARMIGMIGRIDTEMLEMGRETHKYFTDDYELYHINEETNQVEFINPEKSSLEHQLGNSDNEFIEFIKYLLEINPQKRPTAREALLHPWLSYKYESIRS